MKNSADLGGCYPPRPSASVDNTLLDLQNSSYPTQPSIIAKYWTWFLQCCFFFVRRKLECTKIHDLSEIVAEFCAAPIFGCTKRYDPHPICTNPPHLINDRSLNTPHQRHCSSYLLISAFWGGVMKDREASFSPNSYVHLKDFWGLTILLVVFYLQKLWNLILVVILCKLNTQPQRFVYMNTIASKIFFCPYDQKSVL